MSTSHALAGYMKRTPLDQSQYEQLAGRRLGTSDWLTIDQRMIDEFAELTGDRQYIHVDPERARHGPFGSTVAHGFLVLSLIGGMGPDLVPPLAGAVAALNFGFDRVRIIRPVPVGARVRAVFDLAAVDTRPSGDVSTRIDVSVELDGGASPCLVAEWLIVHHLPPRRGSLSPDLPDALPSC
jgi:acyl dehydratase